MFIETHPDNYREQMTKQDIPYDNKKTNNLDI